MKRVCYGILAALGMLALILDGKTALSGASQGIALCLTSLIPSLFPFFILSSLISAALSGQKTPGLSFLEKLCGMPEGTGSLFLVGLLGGYPMGAQCCGEAYRQGALSKEDAQRMCAFCNQAGPSFLFGLVAPFFSSPYDGWLLWLVLIISAVITAALLPKASHRAYKPIQREIPPLTKHLERAVRSMALVCGWVILFRVLLSFLNCWVLWLVSPVLKAAISGLLELANGCMLLQTIPNEGLRFSVAAAILSFGGLCVFFQTSTAMENLKLGTYLCGKLLQCLIAALLSFLVQFLLPFPGRIPISARFFGFTLFFFLLFAAFRKIRSSNRKRIVV